MSACFVQYVPCPECGGTGRQDRLLKGSGVLCVGADNCWRCWGFATVRRVMTKEEVLAALEGSAA